MLQEWKIRPLESIYPFIFLDAIHYKVKEDGRYIGKAFYTDTELCLKAIKILLQTSSLTKKIAYSEEDYFTFRKENNENISIREKLEEIKDREKTRQNR